MKKPSFPIERHQMGDSKTPFFIGENQMFPMKNARFPREKAIFTLCTLYPHSGILPLLIRNIKTSSLILAYILDPDSLLLTLKFESKWQKK